MDGLVIVGAGGHGKVVADIALKKGYGNLVFLDDNYKNIIDFPYKIVGDFKDRKLFRNFDFIVAIGNNKIREEKQTILEVENFNLATLIDPSAIIGRNCFISKGTVIMAGVVINSSTYIGKGNIINTSSSIDHDCRVGDFCHISIGTHIAGTVKIGCNVFVGAGCVIINNVNVCDNICLGASTLVIKDINDSGTYIGIPSFKIK